MQHDHPEHPFRTWRKSQGHDYETISRLVSALGGQAVPRYVEAIEQGWRRPHYDLADVFSQVSGRAVTTEQIMKHPLKSVTVRSSRKRAA